MKKTLKLVAIFASVIIVIVVGGLSGYFLISKNKTFYIYDLRLVEPISYANTYVYTTDTLSYKTIKNKKVYLTSKDENLMQIAVYAHTSNETTNVEITSSNEDIARIEYKNNKCYVRFLKAGDVKIKTTLGGVEDSFNVQVFNRVVDDFCVYDYKYYGDYAEYFPNMVMGYSDSLTYAYDYKAFSVAGDEAGDLLNNDMLRIDTTKVDYDVFESVSIDAKNKQLKIKCKSNTETNVDRTIPIQSYSYTESGEIKVNKNYIVNVHVVTYIPEFLQILLATTPDFEDADVLMNTRIIESPTHESVEADRSTLTDYLSYQKAENNLIQQNEYAVYESYFTDKVSKVYLKFRKVYTNGDIVYLDPKTVEADSNYLTVEPTGDYCKLVLTEDYFTAPDKTFDIRVSLSDFDLNYTFKFKFAELVEDNVDLFYKFDEEAKIYTYYYWDERTRFDGEIYNELGQIIGFSF